MAGLGVKVTKPVVAGFGPKVLKGLIARVMLTWYIVVSSTYFMMALAVSGEIIYETQETHDCKQGTFGHCAPHI